MIEGSCQNDELQEFMGYLREEVSSKQKQALIFLLAAVDYQASSPAVQGKLDELLREELQHFMENMEPLD